MNDMKDLRNIIHAQEIDGILYTPSSMAAIEMQITTNDQNEAMLDHS